VTKGGNYGYAEREGNEQFSRFLTTQERPEASWNPPVQFPATDRLTVEGLPER